MTRPLGSKEIMETGIRTMRVTQRENVEGEGGESGRKQRARGGGRTNDERGLEKRTTRESEKKEGKKLEAEKNGEREIKLREVAGRVAVIPTAYYSHRPVNRAEKNMHGGCGGRKEQH